MASDAEERKELVSHNWQMHQVTKTDANKIADNIIFVVSTGAVAISIGFLSTYEGSLNFIETFSLLLSWASLLTSLFASWVAQWCLSKCSRLNQEILNWHSNSNFEWPHKNWNLLIETLDEPIAKSAMNFAKWYESARLIALTALFIGMVFLFLFGGSILIARTDWTISMLSQHGWSVVQSALNAGMWGGIFGSVIWALNFLLKKFSTSKQGNDSPTAI